jgi:hypothetical protein
MKQKNLLNNKVAGFCKNACRDYSNKRSQRHQSGAGLVMSLAIAALMNQPLQAQTTGPNSTQSPYLQATSPGVTFTSILTARDSIGNYKLSGTPDGVGAYDNGNGTFTMLVNHEFGNTSGVVRAHGSVGAFVSKWVINKSNLAVVSGGDLIQSVRLWDTTTSTFITNTTAFGRFCSADLPATTAFYNSVTGLGTQERIFMNGEETGNEGRAFGHIATGPNAGVTYELPYLGKFSWENSVASPVVSNKTVVAGLDDATGGQVYFYIGNKTNTGTEIDRAGLNGGILYGVAVAGYVTESNGTLPASGTRFNMTSLGTVQKTTGAQLQTASINNGVTGFLRPEDGAWDPTNKRDFYFATTNAFNSPSRLWRLRFDDTLNYQLGGTIEVVLDGTEGQQMLDNIGMDNYGHILMVEDVGGNAHIGKVWQYTIANDQLKQVGRHDSTRFLNNGAQFLTQDEEASGVVDVQSILGAGWFLIVDQAHYTTNVPSDIVEGGQLLAMYNPDTYNSSLALPLQLTAFSAKLSSNKTYLSWKTLNEDNTSYFEIEKSNDGTTFKKVALVNAAGSGNNTYQSIDNAPQAGNNYYRLKMFDKDGKFTYSYVALIKVSKDGKAEFVMYPNPAKDQLMISPASTGGVVSLNIYNQHGQKVMSKQIPAATTTISVSTLPTGVYTVQVIADGVSETHKLIKE